MDLMPVRYMWAIMLAAIVTAYAVPRLACGVPLDETCTTDAECECMYGAQR